MKQDNSIVWVLIILFLLAFSGGGGGIIGGGKPDQVVYVYEKDDGAPPSYVSGAIGRLNAAGIMANSEDDDTRDASGEIADQYKVAFPEAVKAGLPALITLSKGKLLKAKTKPTEADFDAIK